jgi:hypothetical protein
MISPTGCGGICVQAALKNKYCFDMRVSAEHMTAKIRLIPPGAPLSEKRRHFRPARGKTTGELDNSIVGAKDVWVPMRTGGCNTAIFIIL